MGVVIEKLTERDIRKFKRELEGYEKYKRVFLIIGFVLLGLTLLSIAGAIVFAILAAINISSESYEYLAIFAPLFSLSLSFAITLGIFTIAMFILRKVLFAKKIENRLTAIEEYEIYQEELKKNQKD